MPVLLLHLLLLLLLLLLAIQRCRTIDYDDNDDDDDDDDDEYAVWIEQSNQRSGRRNNPPAQTQQQLQRTTVGLTILQIGVVAIVLERFTVLLGLLLVLFVYGFHRRVAKQRCRPAYFAGGCNDATVV